MLRKKGAEGMRRGDNREEGRRGKVTPEDRLSRRQ
jgi:hypothetical protein